MSTPYEYEYLTVTTELPYRTGMNKNGNMERLCRVTTGTFMM